MAATGAKAGDLIVAVSAAEQIPGTDAAALIAGQLRLSLAERLDLIPKDRWEFLWLTGFPLFEWSASEKTWASAQHPFTGIVEEDLDKLESEPQNVRSKGYDLVLNGAELGSGSIRIHSQELQARVFAALGLDEEQRRERFGFFLDALTYGTPPHGGIALGIDRVVALLAGEKSMREVIAFPKTTAAQDLMAGLRLRLVGMNCSRNLAFCRLGPRTDTDVRTRTAQWTFSSGNRKQVAARELS